MEYCITQSGPALGRSAKGAFTGDVCYMAGLKNTAKHIGEYFGAEATLTQAFALIAVHAKKHGQPFTVEYIPHQ